MDWAQLRTRCESQVTTLLAHVALPNPWDLNAFVDRLERWRGREIDLVGVPWTAGLSTGAWQPRSDHDLIAYAENTTSLHQDHIILHEIGHMICDHRGTCVLSLSTARHIAPHLTPTAFAHLLGRTTVANDEAEAETIATLILAQIARQDRRQPRARKLNDTTAETVARMTKTFDQP
jgi:hypothetical protein